MKLKELEIGERFRFKNGNEKIYKKINDHGDILEFNTCICLSDLNPAQKSGLMIISASYHSKHYKNAEVCIISERG